MARTGNSRLMRRFLRGMGFLALVAGLTGLANAVTPDAHATRAGTTLHPNFIDPICRSCLASRPSIQATYVGYAINVSGSNFTPGGAVHIAILQYLQDPTVVPGQTPPSAETVATADIKATLALTIPLGNGRVVHTTGGQITATLSSPSLACSLFPITVVATDEATGFTATVAPSSSC